MNSEYQTPHPDPQICIGQKLRNKKINNLAFLSRRMNIYKHLFLYTVKPV